MTEYVVTELEPGRSFTWVAPGVTSTARHRVECGERIGDGGDRVSGPDGDSAVRQPGRYGGGCTGSTPSGC